MSDFSEKVQEFDEILGKKKKIDTIVPYGDGKVTKVPIKNKNNEKNEEYYRQRFCYGLIESGLFDQALKFRDKNTHSVTDYDSFKKIIKRGGFVRCGWDGEQATEAKIKEQTAATIRCIPFDENPNGLNCVFTGKPAKHEVIFAKAY